MELTVDILSKLPKIHMKNKKPNHLHKEIEKKKRLDRTLKDLKT